MSDKIKKCVPVKLDAELIHWEYTDESSDVKSPITTMIISID